MEVQSTTVRLHTRIDRNCYELHQSTTFPGTCSTDLDIIHKHGHGFSALVALGQVYVAGGVGDGYSPRCGFYKFDPHRGVWVILSPMPVGLAYPAMVELGGYIYVMGSSSQKYYDSFDVLRFCDATRQWQQISPLPEKLSDMSAVALSEHVLVAGSYDCHRSINKLKLCVFALNPKTCVWTVAYEACVLVPSDRPYIRQYPIQLFMYNGMCYFQSLKYTHGQYEVQVEEVHLDFIGGQPVVVLGEEVDQASTFGALLADEDVRSSELLTFDKRKMKMVKMQSECSLQHNKAHPFFKAFQHW